MAYCRICREQVAGPLKEHLETVHVGYLQESRKWSYAGMACILVLSVLGFLARQIPRYVIYIFASICFILVFYTIIYQMYYHLDKKYREKAKLHQLVENKKP